MTSISLFSKRIKTELKRNLGILSLGCLVFFLVLPVSLAMSMGRWASHEPHEVYDSSKRLMEYLSDKNDWILIIGIIGAIICAMSQFHYLQTRQQTDFYHSIPINRKQLFLIKFVSGGCIYLFAFFSNLILEFLVIVIKKEVSTQVVLELLKCLGINTIGFFLLYLITIFAIMLTGNRLVSICVTILAFFYSPAVIGVLQGLKERFFMTYTWSYETIFEQTVLFSPVSAYYMLLVKMKEGFNQGWWYLAGIITADILLFMLVRYVYTLRSNDAAQKAVAFPIAHVIIKSLVVIVASLWCGYIFDSISNQSNAWFYFGLLFGFLISYAITEIVHHFDFRKAFAQKLQLAILGVCILAIACVFRFDWLGYDTYLPSINEVKYASVYFDDLSERQGNYSLTENGLTRYSNLEYWMEHMRLTNIDNVLTLAQEGIQRLDASTPRYLRNVIIHYQLKNGSTRERAYEIPLGEEEELVAAIYNTLEFKRGTTALYEIPTYCISEINCSRDTGYANLNLSATEKELLVTTYLSELEQMDYQQYSSQAPIASLEFVIKRLKDSGIMTYYIYPDFTETIALIQKYEFPLDIMRNVDKIPPQTQRIP